MAGRHKMWAPSAGSRGKKEYYRGEKTINNNQQ